MTRDGSLNNFVIRIIKLFLIIHIINLALEFLIGGFWDAGLSVGFPVAFYGINCGLGPTDCDLGFNALRFLLTILFWYCVAVILKRNDQ